MHFKLDENIPIRLKDFIKVCGHECSTVFDQNISGKTDKELISICKKEMLIFITLDSDFSNIFSYPTSSHNGIIFIKTKEQGAESVIKMFKKMASTIDIKMSLNSIVVVSEESVKIRK